MIRKFTHRVGLAALLLGYSGALFAAQAAPDPLFEPILDDLQQELPDGWQFRLPAALPSDSELYPFISQASETEVVVSLGLTPDCADPSCAVGLIGVTDVEPTADNWPPTGDNVTPVDLGPGIEGYYLQRGEGEAMNQLVMWQQDGLTYAIATLADSSSQEEFIAIARSMASEPPISAAEDGSLEDDAIEDGSIEDGAIEDAPLEDIPAEDPITPMDEPESPAGDPISPTEEPMSPTDEPLDPSADPMSPTDEPLDPVESPATPLEELPE